MAETTVFLAHIKHDHGDNLYAAGSEKELTTKLAEYCRDYWSDFKSGEPPEDDEECVTEYFEENDQEWLTTDSDTITVQLAEVSK